MRGRGYKRPRFLFPKTAEWLTELDTAIGDGDHGENMMRGFTAVEKKLVADIAAKLAGVIQDGWYDVAVVGGRSGRALIRRLFSRIGKSSAGQRKTEQD